MTRRHSLSLDQTVTEEWKSVPGFEGFYAASSLGHIKRLAPGKGARAGRILRPTNWRGYLGVRLSRDGKTEQHWVHRLVLRAFLGEAPEGCTVNHLNGKRGDNRLVNLEWLTPGENVRHARDVLGIELGWRGGEKHPAAKLTQKEVDSIRELWMLGQHTQTRLGRMFGVCGSQIGRIVRREQWARD